MDSNRITENPITGERFRWHVTEQESNGRLARAEAWVRPGGGVFVEHLHPHSEERFEVLEGRLVLEVGSDQCVLLAGEQARVVPGVRHRWRNGGNEELHMFVEVSEPRGFESMIEDVFAAARAGQTDERGRLKLLDAAPIMLRHAGNTRAASPPYLLQRAILPPLALLGTLARKRREAGRAPATAAAAVLLTALAVVLTMLNAPRADAYTVVDHRTATGAERLDVRCGEAVAFSSRLPSGAKNVAVAEPRAGQVVRDGFGDLELARVEAVEVRPDPAGPLLEITVRGSGSTCDSPGGVWETGPVDFRVSYDLVSHPELRVSDDQAGMHAKRRPRGLTATSEAGWRSLRWRSWGRATATARGTFDVVRWVSVGHNGVDPRWVSYPVEVTLSRVRLCGQGYLYTRIDTRFTKRAPREVRRQAKPPGTASCLDG